MSRMHSIAFTPAPIGQLEVKNRLVRLATYESAATRQGEVSDFLVDLYRTLSKGGVGLIITGITGAEDDFLPFTRSGEKPDVEEERRLFYVGMTRAKDDLLLLHARNRFVYGQRLARVPSPFLAEIPEEFIRREIVPDRPRKQGKQDSLF
jgi:hypothetical protein